MRTAEPSPIASPQPAPVLGEAEARTVRRGVPDPGIRLPQLAAPTVALFAASLVVWGVATWLALVAGASAWVTVPLHALVTFTMFTVLHEATHHAAGRSSSANAVLGRLSLPFVACYASFGMIRYIHLEHHRNTNEDLNTDPDAWTSHGPWWQLPLRWTTVDAWYTRFYAGRAAGRPRAEVAETLAAGALTVAVLAAAIGTGHLWQLAVVYLIPQRIGLGVLAWWFDWLPHHGLTETAAQNRFRSTRIRVGLEWLLTPGMLYQNYHLVHHLHPAIPFYRYVQAWQRNQDTYLARDVPIATAWGRELTASEYRAWRQITASFDAAAATDLAASGPQFHELSVAEVRPLTEDSVAIRFAVPDALREQFRFTAGQHVTVRRTVDGVEVRRTYSICAAATSDVVRIAVRKVRGGRLSTWLVDDLRVGDVVDVLPPTGRFTLTPEPGTAKHYVGIAAGSGITPVLAMLSTALAVEPDSRFTLIYGNRSTASTMFRDELQMLVRRFEGRLRVLHVLADGTAGAPSGTRLEETHAGRIDAERLTALLADRLHPGQVDAWYVCGPQALTETATRLLAEQGVPADAVHRELFHAQPAAPGPDDDTGARTVTATLHGRTHTVPRSPGQSVLDAALRHGLPAPYSCMGGACGSCRARVVLGAGQMELNYALDEADVAAGYVLTCQTRPATRELAVDYDA